MTLDIVLVFMLFNDSKLIGIQCIHKHIPTVPTDSIAPNCNLKDIICQDMIMKVIIYAN